ncbi:thermonuclease family protein [Falsirhodobacter sp. alg1]|uniref:thermonuclease family protein n=1 Tax=Falsirhodobacter sp. alg1 TaxID=1472418 RepID=UPI00178CECBC|nr:thermonuclease family protein [Falsirhodobacter sp. alg1]
MAKRKKTTRIPGPKIWAIAAALLLAGWIFGGDDPQMRKNFFDMAERLLTEQPEPGEMIAGGARIIDGDTLDLNGERIRLYGIDAPESAQTCKTGAREWQCGAEATRALVQMIGTQQVTCEKTDTDRYGRSIATCKAGDVSINTWMVRNGWAVAYRQYGGEIYGANEDAARNDRAGIWASSFDMPWDWRKAH